MAWNEPGRDKNSDPWNGRNRQSPPDLEQSIKKLLSALFGFSKRSFSGFGRQQGLPPLQLSLFAGGVFLVLLVLWALSGIYIVQQGERAVVLRFGKYQETSEPGPHWRPRFIDDIRIVNTQKISIYPYSSEMLTRDANIVSVGIAIHFRVSNARDYLFSVVNPQESLKQATASALRQVIGHTDLDTIMTTGRSVVRSQVQNQLQKILSAYRPGLTVTDVNMQEAKAPEPVKDAFDNAIKAQEKEQQFINEAQAYANGVVPKAEGRAQRLLAEARAYEQGVVLKARGAVARYLAILPVYNKAPRVTGERLYLHSIESVLSQSSTILLDGKSNPMLYLPLQELMKRHRQMASSPYSSVATEEINLDKSSPIEVEAEGAHHLLSRENFTRDKYRRRS